MPTSIPAFDPRPQNLPLLDEIKSAMNAVLDSGQFIGGPALTSFESDFASVIGSPHAIGVSSGTDALLAALMALDVGPGTTVITTPFTFFATAGAVHRLGARVQFVDIDPASFNLDVDAVERALAQAPTDAPVRAVIAVHLFGRAAPAQRLAQLTRDAGVALIEDTAQALGAVHEGQPLGSWGDVGCFSFYPTKNLGGVGDAGAITCRDDALAERIRRLRNHGMKEAYHHVEVGGNFRLDGLQAAALGVKLRYLEEWNATRCRLADLYRTHFGALAAEAVQLPAPGAPGEHVYHQFVVRVPDRDGVRARMAEQGVGSAVYYPVPLDRQPCLAMHAPATPLVESDRAAEEVLALPMYPGLSDEDVARVASTVVDALP